METLKFLFHSEFHEMVVLKSILREKIGVVSNGKDGKIHDSKRYFIRQKNIYLFINGIGYQEGRPIKIWKTGRLLQRK